MPVTSFRKFQSTQLFLLSMHVEKSSLVARRQSQNHMHEIRYFPYIFGNHQPHDVVYNIASKGVAGEILKVPQRADIAILLRYRDSKELDKIICSRYYRQIVSHRRWTGCRDFR